MVADQAESWPVARSYTGADLNRISLPLGGIGTGTVGDPKLTFKITKVSDPKLLKGYLAVRVDVTGNVKGKRVAQTSYAIYQQRGTVLSGIYSFGGTNAAQLKLALHAAEASARNLRRGGSGVSWQGWGS